MCLSVSRIEIQNQINSKKFILVWIGVSANGVPVLRTLGEKGFVINGDVPGMDLKNYGIGKSGDSILIN